MAFVPGIEFSRRFWLEAVRPILTERVPPAELAAGLLGAGSEVLDLDTEQSTDHSWGPRVVVFVPPTTDVPALDAELERRLTAGGAASFSQLTTREVRPRPLACAVSELCRQSRPAAGAAAGRCSVEGAPLQRIRAVEERLQDSETDHCA